MKTLVQDTDSSNGASLPFQIEFGSPERRENVTYGTYVEAAGFDVGFEAQSLERALSLSMDLEDKELVKTIGDLLNVLVGALEAYYEIAPEPRPLPPLHVYKTEDGSLIMEWVDNHFRVGFGIGPTVHDSSWYLVTDDKLGSLSYSGLLRSEDLNQRALSLVDFVLSNT